MAAGGARRRLRAAERAGMTPGHLGRHVPPKKWAHPRPRCRVAGRWGGGPGGPQETLKKTPWLAGRIGHVRGGRFHPLGGPMRSAYSRECKAGNWPFLPFSKLVVAESFSRPPWDASIMGSVQQNSTSRSCSSGLGRGPPGPPPHRPATRHLGRGWAHFFGGTWRPRCPGVIPALSAALRRRRAPPSCHSPN